MILENFKKNKNKNLFDIAMGWYISGDSGKKDAALDLFPEDIFKKEIEAYRKREKKEREETLQKMLKRCQELFHIGDVIESDDISDHLPNLIISPPYIKKVDYLPFCVENCWNYKESEKYTIVVDTVRLYMNKPLGKKNKVCLESLLYYMDKSNDDEFRKKGFIDLKEYAKTQIVKKEKELHRLKDEEERYLKNLNDIQSKIKELEDYNPNELTKEKIKKILLEEDD